VRIKHAAAAAAVALAAGCGGAASTPAAHGHSPATKPSSPSGPQRIVSLSPTSTEDLFAVGAGGQVVAVDKFSDYPPKAPDTHLSSSHPNPEAIAKYRPYLVVIANDTAKIKEQLAKLHIAVLVEPAATTLRDAYQQIRELGARTGHRQRAAHVVVSMRKRITALTKSVPHRKKPLTYYYELTPDLYTVTSKTFIGRLLARVGLKNVADAAGKDNAYPQISAEYLVKADPDLVFLADTKCCKQNAKTFAGRPGFDTLSAVRDGNVVGLDDDIASRWGPRIVDLLQRVVKAIKAVHAR
jgi:iron complex transport system substrate-binding protein